VKDHRKRRAQCAAKNVWDRLPDIPHAKTCTRNYIPEGAFGLWVFQVFLKALFAFALKEMVVTLCHLSLVPRERNGWKLKD